MSRKQLYLKMLASAPWLPSFDDQQGGQQQQQGGQQQQQGGQSGSSTTKTFTQDDVNKMLADDRRKHQQQTQKAIEELEALKARSSLTENEKSELESRIEQMHQQILSKEELAKRETDKLKKQSEERIKGLETEANTWKDRYTDSTIVRSITDAAATNEAYAPEQIVAILRQKTRLTEELGEDGKPNGNFIPTVKFDDVDSKGKPVTLELTVPQAVKRMSEIEKYFNLFKNKGSGGTGGSGSRGGTGPIDIKKAAQDPAEYRRLRKEGKI